MATTDSAQRSEEAARTRIVAVAFEHFAQHWFRGGSLARIAREVGISQTGLLHHFPSKAALLQAVLGARDLRDLTAAEATGPDHPAFEWVTMRLAFMRSMIESALRRGIDDIALQSLTAAGGSVGMLLLRT